MERFISNFLFSNLFVYFMKFMSSQATSKAVRIQYFFCSASSHIQTGYGRQRCIQKSKMERSAKIADLRAATFGDFLFSDIACNFLNVLLFQKNCLLCKCIEITLWHGCSLVNLPYIFRTPFPKNTCYFCKLKYIIQLRIVYLMKSYRNT